MTNSNYSEFQLQQAYEEVRKDYIGRENVTGVDIGYKYVEGRRTDDIVVRIHVKEKIPQFALEAEEIFPEEINGIPVDVMQCVYGLQVALKSSSLRKSWCNPIQPGLSISHPNVTAGTWGVVVYDNATGRPCILSNWHVLVGSFDASPGDPIIQPGSKDGGRLPADRVGQLERSVLGSDGDAAIAFLDTTLERSVELAQFETGVVLHSTRNAQVGEVLEKSGRTTGVTRGKVVGYGSYKIPYSVGERTIDGFIISSVIAGNPDNEEISSGGDSGAIWYNPETQEAVGLHFAGETASSQIEEHALACHLPRVLAALNISLATTAPENS
jgi:endonuclease G